MKGMKDMKDRNSRTRKRTIWTFVVVLFIVQGVYLLVYKGFNLLNILVYFGKVLLILLAPVLVILGILLIVNFFRKLGNKNNK